MLTAHPIVSADSHVTEHPDAYRKYAAVRDHEAAPHVERADGGNDLFVIPGMTRPFPMGLVAAAGRPPEEIRSAAVRGLHRGGWDPDASRSPTRTATASPPRSSTRRSAWCCATTRTSTTSRRASTPTTAGSPSTARAHPTGCSASARPRCAPRGGHRRPARDQGARAAGRDAAGHARRVEDYDSPDLRRVLGGRDRPRAAAVVPHPHHADDSAPTARAAHEPLPRRSSAAARTSWACSCSAACSSAIPTLRVVCVEADAGWVPHFMYRMDHAYKRHRNWLPRGRAVAAAAASTSPSTST